VGQVCVNSQPLAKVAEIKKKLRDLFALIHVLVQLHTGIRNRTQILFDSVAWKWKSRK